MRLALRLLKIKLRIGLWLLFLVALYVSLGRYFTLSLTEYRSDIEQILTHQLQQTIRLGSIEGRWHGFSPIVHAGNVTIGQDAERLHVGRIHIQLDITKSLLTRSWQLAAISLDNVQLGLLEDKQGVWSVVGLNTMQGTRQGQARTLSQWLEPFQHVAKLSIVNAQFYVQRFADEAYSVSDAGITLENLSGSQQIQARIQLPDKEILELHARGTDLFGDWKKSRLQLYLKTSKSDLAQWLPKSLLEQPIQHLQLDGQIWLDVKYGVPERAVLRLAQGRLAMQLQEKSLDIRLGQANGYFQGDASQQTLWFERLQLGFAEQENYVDWPLKINRQYRGGEPGVIKVQARQLDVQPIVQLLARFAPSEQAQIMQALNPKGQLHNAFLRWEPETDWAHQLQFDVNAQDIAFSPWQHVPGASGVSGRILGNLQQGELHLRSDGFSLFLSELFADPWYYQTASARLVWTLDELGFTLASPYMQLKGDEGDLAGDMFIRLFKDPEQEDYMDLRVGMRDGDADYTERYLPLVLQRAQPKLFDWLTDAIVSGNIREGYFQYQGAISAGASDMAQSFSLFFDVTNAHLDYQPDWPALTQADAKVYVHDWGVQVELAKGQILDAQVQKAHAEVRYEQPYSTLTLNAELSGQVNDGLYIVQKTPLRAHASALADWHGHGQIATHLELSIPFAEQPVQARVNMQLENAMLQMPGLDVKLEQLNGDVHFDSRQGVSAKQLGGLFLQQKFTADIIPKQLGEQWITQIQAQGRMPVERLKRWLNQDNTLPVKGDFAYQLLLNLNDADTQLIVESDLRGVSIELPEPLAKRAQQRIDSKWSMTLAGRERRFDLRYGTLIHFNGAAGNDGKGRLRAEVALGGQKARLPVEPGLQIRGQLQQLPVTNWLALLERYPLVNDKASGSANPLRAIELNVDHIVGFVIPIEQAKLLVQPDETTPGAWKAQIDSKQIKGRMYVPVASQPIQVHFEFMHLPQFVEQSVGNVTTQLKDLNPKSIPAMQVTIEQLYSGEQPVGRCELRTEQHQDGIRFADIDLEFKGLHIMGDLLWQQKGLNASSQFTGQLTGDNLAEVLQAWDYSPSISSERFKVELDTDWPGSPMDMALTRLNGAMRISFRKGQLKAVDGIAKALRVFGLLNFDSIGRRLRLDFSDLLGKGLSYDTFKGRFAIHQGVYTSLEPFVLKGVSSELSFEGQVDLPNEQVDARLLVAMPLTGNLPLAAVLVGAPAVGGALFIMERLIGERIDRMAAVNYQISGSLQEPEISILKN